MKIVQIGTNDGNDDVRNFCIKERPDFVLLVEPFNIHLDKIKQNYSEIIDSVHIENIAIHPTENLETVTLYYTDRDGPLGDPRRTYEVTSMISNHLIKHGYRTPELKTFNVPALTLNSLFEKYSLSSIDYLFLDIEGIDFEVLKSIDFEKYDIQYLQIEHLHLDINELKLFMFKNGYRPLYSAIDTRGYDTMFKKLSVLQKP